MTPLPKKTATSANKQTIEILGITESISFKFKDSTKIFQERFYVIKGLAHEVNLGKKFLAKHGAIHDHEKEQLKFGNEVV